jgi:S1-C subfamily serine protease
MQPAAQGGAADQAGIKAGDVITGLGCREGMLG